MRSSTESEVREWLKCHPEETIKIFNDMNTSSSNIRTRSDKDCLIESREIDLFNLLHSAILANTELSKKLDSFCCKVSQLFDVEKCAILVLNRDKNELEVKGNMRWGPQKPINMSRGIVGRAASLNEMIFVKDPSRGTFCRVIT